MREKTYKPMTAEELVNALEVREIEHFLALLRELEQEGKIIFTRKKKYGLPEKMGLVVGRLHGHPKGFAFVIPDTPGMEDVYIGADGLNGAMHNDRVVARVHRRQVDGQQPEGEIIRILERANRFVVGTLERSRHFGFVVPDETRIAQDIFISRNDLNGARQNDKVVVEIVRWPEKRRNPEGKVVEILGRRGEPGVDIISIMRKYQLPEEFPLPVMKEAEKIPLTISEEDLQGRKDLRDWTIVTIDGEDAKDLDDAVSIQVLDNGNFLLGVHIADVSHYVKEGSELDREAYRRGTSVYLVDRVIPMLPPRLSNGICSLNAGEDRLTVTVLMEVDREGQVVRYDIFKSVIRVKERMTYTNVRKILLEEDPVLMERYGELIGSFRLMEQLCRILYRRRLERGAIDFDFPEVKVRLDEQGKPVELIRVERSIAEQIIEEFMVLANETVAEHFYWLEAPFVYRVHEKPDPEAVKQLNQFLKRFGYHVKGVENEIHPRAFQEVVEQVEGKPSARIINTVMLRSMKHARYASQCLGHFGLAAPYYCHFTSPIRRYPDLVIHRVIGEILNKGALSSRRKAKLERKMPDYAKQSSIRELVAEEAERETLDLKKVEYMQRHLGDVFPAVVSNVVPYGMFVEMENLVEGFVHVSTLTDDYYEYQEAEFCLLGQHTRKSYRIGDIVTVQVVRVDTEARRIDCELVSG